MIFMAFYRNMVVPTKSENIAFEEFLKELPADYSEMAYEFKAFTLKKSVEFNSAENIQHKLDNPIGAMGTI